MPRVRLPFRVPPPQSRPFDVVGFGLNSVDLVAVIDEYPAPNSKHTFRSFGRFPGGQIATAMTVCARLGLNARYVGSFGDDELGELSRASLVDEGVDVGASRTVRGATNQVAIVLVDARSGERTILWHRHPALSMDPDAVPREVIASGRMLIVDCYETAAATRAATFARGAGIPTIIDVENVRPGIGDLLAQIDAIVAAECFPRELTGHDDPGRALEALDREFHAPLVCVTLGAEGSLARAVGREIRTPAFSVDCVDSTGAGDAFRGGFAAACLRSPDGSLEDALRYANAVAALNCRALGARGGLPTADQVAQLLYAKR
jgi:sulfofructose kinase